MLHTLYLILKRVSIKYHVPEVQKHLKILYGALVNPFFKKKKKGREREREKKKKKFTYVQFWILIDRKFPDWLVVFFERLKRQTICY